MAKFLQKYSNVILMCCFTVCVLCMLFLPLKCYVVTQDGYTLWVTALSAIAYTTLKSDGYTFTFITNTSLLIAIFALAVAGVLFMCFNRTYILGVALSAASGLAVCFTKFITITVSGFAGELHTSKFVIIIFTVMAVMAVVKGAAILTQKQTKEE